MSGALPTVAWLYEHPEHANYVSLTGVLWSARRREQEESTGAKCTPLCRVPDAEAAITQARQDERERAFRAGWESAAALQYAGDGNDEIPPSKSVVAKMALDAFARGLTDGGNSK